MTDRPLARRPGGRRQPATATRRLGQVSAARHRGGSWAGVSSARSPSSRPPAPADAAVPGRAGPILPGTDEPYGSLSPSTRRRRGGPQVSWSRSRVLATGGYGVRALTPRV